MSQFQIDVGSIGPRANKSIHFNVISLIEGTIELSQVIRYRVASSKRTQRSDSTQNELNDTNIVPSQTNPKAYNHGISIEYIEDVVVKSKKETIVIPCTAEFLFTGKFYSLNKEALNKAYKDEDFLFRVELEIKSVDIDILDMFLISVSQIIT